MALAASTASSAVRATRPAGTAMPYSPNNCLAWYSLEVMGTFWRPAARGRGDGARGPEKGAYCGRCPPKRKTVARRATRTVPLSPPCGERAKGEGQTEVARSATPKKENRRPRTVPLSGHARCIGHDVRRRASLRLASAPPHPRPAGRGQRVRGKLDVARSATPKRAAPYTPGEALRAYAPPPAADAHPPFPRRHATAEGVVFLLSLPPARGGVVRAGRIHSGWLPVGGGTHADRGEARRRGLHRAVVVAAVREPALDDAPASPGRHRHVPGPRRRRGRAVGAGRTRERHLPAADVQRRRRRADPHRAVEPGLRHD